MVTAEAPTTISACVIARDEAGHLRELLPRLRWANEIVVVVDDRTSDESVVVATELADQVVVATFISFAQFRSYALDRCAGDWVLFVDADERVPAALQDEVRHAVAGSEQLRARGSSEAPAGYWVPRHNVMFGRLVRGGGWSPDYQLRLLHRARARYDVTRPVHELAVLDGPAGYLSQRLIHFNYESIGQFLSKQRVYSELEVAGLCAQGVTYRLRALLGQPLREFVRRYVVLGGWRDGPLGLFLCGALAYFAFRRVQLVRAATRDSEGVSSLVSVDEDRSAR